MSDITNFTFFQIVDKQVREAMQQVETAMLPLAKQALLESGLSLQEHPVEGYYGKIPELTQFFNHIRTLQSNPSDKVGPAILRLHDFYTNEVFGLGQAVSTAVNSKGVWYPHAPSAVISPMVDPLTVALSEVAQSSETVRSDLTIPNVTKSLESIASGKSLVGFAALVDKVERGDSCVYNPVATTLARATTVLSAYSEFMLGVPEYQVSPQVESMGNAVIDAYNALFAGAGSEVRIPNITEKNAFDLNQDLPSMNQCVRIFNLELPGQPKSHYHWAVNAYRPKPSVVDFWDTQVVTTDMFQQSPEQYLSFSSGLLRR